MQDQVDKFWESFDKCLEKEQSLRERFGDEMTEDELKQEYENAKVDLKELKVKLESLKSRENDEHEPNNNSYD